MQNAWEAFPWGRADGITERQAYELGIRWLIDCFKHEFGG